MVGRPPVHPISSRYLSCTDQSPRIAHKLRPAPTFGRPRSLGSYTVLDADLALSETLDWMTWRVDARSTVSGPSGRPASSDVTMRPLTPVGIWASTS